MPISPSCEVEWSDPTLTTNTQVKTIHIQELREVLNRERSDRLMQTVSFTDSQLDTSTKIRMVHIEELRQAIEQTPKYTTCTDYYSDVHSHENQTDEGNQYVNHHRGEHTAHDGTKQDTYHHEFRHCSTYDSGVHGSYNHQDDNPNYVTHDYHKAIQWDCGDENTVYDHNKDGVRSTHDYSAWTSHHTGQRYTENTNQRQQAVGTFCTQFQSWKEKPFPSGVHMTTSIDYSTGNVTVNCPDLGFTYYADVHGQQTLNIPGDITCNVERYSQRSDLFLDVYFQNWSTRDMIVNTHQFVDDDVSLHSAVCSDHDAGVGVKCIKDCTSVKSFVFAYEKGTYDGHRYTSYNNTVHTQLDADPYYHGGSPGGGTSGVGTC